MAMAKGAMPKMRSVFMRKGGGGGVRRRREEEEDEKIMRQRVTLTLGTGGEVRLFIYVLRERKPCHAGAWLHYIINYIMVR